jgi:PPOX class probable F420-dependent enzyme
VTKRTLDELGDLLELPYTAVMSTYWPDGSVLLSPVWHEWRDGGFNIGVGENDIKLRHIARDPRVTVVVYDHSWPGRGFEVRGIAQVTTEARHEVSRRLSVRYLGPKNGNAYADRVGSGVVVRVEPGIARGWEYSGETQPDPEILVFPGVQWPPAERFGGGIVESPEGKGAKEVERRP